MASGPYFDARRGTYRIQWFDGAKWRRPVVYRIPGWKAGAPEPKKKPPETHAALAAYAEKEKAARLRRPGDPERTAADFLASYAAGYRCDQASGSALQLAQASGNFLGWCRANRIAKLDDVTPSACQTYLSWRARQISRKTGKPISPGRVNQERGLLSGAWSRAARLGDVAANPWTPTVAPGWAKSRKARRRKPSWTPEEFAELIKQARPWLADLLTLGTQTGFRVNVLIHLEWRDVEFDKAGPTFGVIRVRPELDKAGRGYSVPISAKAHDLLGRRMTSPRCSGDLVLASDRGKKLRVCVCDRSIHDACRKAKLPHPESPNHMMRRSFGRWAVHGDLTGRPVPVYVVSKWMGHSDITTTQGYLDLDHDASQDWMAEYAPARDQGANEESGQRRCET